MAEEEPILTHPPTPEVARHVDDYSRFIWMVKWSTISAAVIGFIVVFLIIA